MASSVILSDNGVTSGTQGVKTIAARSAVTTSAG